MKKISVLVMLFISVTIFIHAQELMEKKVTIYLVSSNVDINGKVEYRLIMYDSNGDIDINDLTTVVKKTREQKGTVYWVVTDGIKEIEEIKAKSDTSIIFKNGAKKLENGKKYMLRLPDNIPNPGEEIKDKYFIKYKPLDKDTTITIDPFIRIPPPDAGN